MIKRVIILSLLLIHVSNYTAAPAAKSASHEAAGAASGQQAIAAQHEVGAPIPVQLPPGALGGGGGVTIVLAPSASATSGAAADAGAAAGAQSAATATSINSVRTQVTTWLDQNISIWNQPSEWPGSAGAFFNRHKRRICFGAGATLYLGVSAQLMRGNRFAHQPDLWANWQKLLSIQELHEHSQSELEKKLREDILKAYLMKAKSPLGAYLQFIKALEYEERRLTQHVTLCTWVKRSRFMRFFPINDEKMQRAEYLLKRLSFIKHIFISWAATQGFERV